MPKLTFDAFSWLNLKRCESPDGFAHKIDSWSESDWMTAIAGEMGETEEQLREALGKEIADMVICCDLLATRLGLKLGDLVRDKWNETSEKIGYPGRLD